IAPLLAEVAPIFFLFLPPNVSFYLCLLFVVGRIVFFKFLRFIFGLLSFIPALMAVIGCYIAYLPANQYPTLNWLSVFLPIILLLNAAIALCWIWKKSLWMIVPLLSILICFP